MILEKTKKKIIIISLLLIFLIAAYYFLVMNIIQKGREIYTMSQKIEETQNKKGSLLSMRENLSLSKEKATRLEDFVLKTGSEVDFIKKIEDLAILSNVKSEIKTAQIEQISGSSTTTVESFRVEINTIGSWSDTIYFLTYIENLPLKVKINNVSFDKFSDYEIKGQKISQWLLSINFSVIKQK